MEKPLKENVNSLPEEQFLLKEFETAWHHLGLLDERRYHIMQYFALYIGGITIACLKLFPEIFKQEGSIWWGIAALMTFNILVVIAFTEMLKSERKATVRYRNKINLIREYFFQKGDAAFKDLIEKGQKHGMGIDKVDRGDLNWFDIFLPRQHNTALFIISFIRLMGLISLAVLILSIIKIFFT